MTLAWAATVCLAAAASPAGELAGSEAHVATHILYQSADDDHIEILLGPTHDRFNFLQFALSISGAPPIRHDPS